MPYLKRACFLSFSLCASAAPALTAAHELSLGVASEYEHKRARIEASIKKVIIEGWRLIIGGGKREVPAFCAPPMAKETVPAPVISWFRLPAGSSLSSSRHLLEERIEEMGLGLLVFTAGAAGFGLDTWGTIEFLLEIAVIRDKLSEELAGKMTLAPSKNGSLEAKAEGGYTASRSFHPVTVENLKETVLRGIKRACDEGRARFAFLLCEALPELPCMVLSNGRNPYKSVEERCYWGRYSASADGAPNLEARQLLYLLDPSRHMYTTRQEFYFSKLHLQTFVEAGFLDKLLERGLVVYEKVVQDGKVVYHRFLACLDNGRVEKVVPVMVRREGLKSSFRDPVGIIRSYVGSGLPIGALSPVPRYCKAFEVGEFLAFQKAP